LGRRVLEDSAGVSRIQHLLWCQAGPPGNRAPETRPLEFGRVMRIRVDDQERPRLPCPPGPGVVQVEAPGAAVDLQSGASPDGLGNHRLQIDAGFTAPFEAPAGWVARYVHVRSERGLL